MHQVSSCSYRQSSQKQCVFVELLQYHIPDCSLFLQLLMNIYKGITCSCARFLRSTFTKLKRFICCFQSACWDLNILIFIQLFCLCDENNILSFRFHSIHFLVIRIKELCALKFLCNYQFVLATLEGYFNMTVFRIPRQKKFIHHLQA